MFYLLATKVFFQNVKKRSKSELLRKEINNHWDAIESIVYIQNKKLETEFEKQRRTFEEEGKVDKYGLVPEMHLFHGTTNESINKIVDNNFCINHQNSSKTGTKLMLFGTGKIFRNFFGKTKILFILGVYFSELPGVSLMYGGSLILCKVLPG